MSPRRLASIKLRRTKSAGDLDVINCCFESKCGKCDCPSSHKCSPANDTLLDSFAKCRKQILSLKQNNQKLRGILMNQLQRVVKVIKDDSQLTYRNIIASFIEESTKTLDELNFEGSDDSGESNQQARSLLAAIEPKSLQIDADIRDALTKLTQKYEHQEQESALLLKRMLKPPKPDESSKRGACLEDGKITRQWWKNLSKNNDQKLDPIHDTMKTKHKSGYENKKLATPDLLPKLVLPPLVVETDHLYDGEQKVPPSPPQPVDPEVSVIDHLMQSAVINKKLSDGDFNGSFEEALSHCNLALLMGACRAAEPAAVFSPCRLSQAVLLSLVQQLATDMVHDTQLKCRYLEEALINLDVTDQVTQKHLPLVVEEVRKHLSKFVRAYPHHVANRRISLIVMAADNLIK
ncbi:uncharacterized protein LOC112049343 [Bicyclus anynana]|uniref:Uncharacterized protein LOC112049343 n=1 Tax=Bicyclus anynana TaxID=110368 RepID=A0A6J1N7V3_BICAN|nr:uncharacterized protein LOC112049343 [Bicyclus anynana]